MFEDTLCSFYIMRELHERMNFEKNWFLHTNNFLIKYVSMTIYLPIYLFLYPSQCIYLFFYLPICLSIYLSVLLVIKNMNTHTHSRTHTHGHTHTILYMSMCISHDLVEKTYVLDRFMSKSKQLLMLIINKFFVNFSKNIRRTYGEMALLFYW